MYPWRVEPDCEAELIEDELGGRRRQGILTELYHEEMARLARRGPESDPLSSDAREVSVHRVSVEGRSFVNGSEQNYLYYAWNGKELRALLWAPRLGALTTEQDTEFLSVAIYRLRNSASPMGAR